MPFCFRFPQIVAGMGSPMCPMPDSESALPALWDHCTAATRAFAREAALSFSTFSINESEFHLFFSFNGQCFAFNCSLATGSCETQAEARQLVAGSCFSSALARWLLMAAVA